MECWRRLPTTNTGHDQDDIGLHDKKDQDHTEEGFSPEDDQDNNNMDVNPLSHIEGRYHGDDNDVDPSLHLEEQTRGNRGDNHNQN